MSPMPSVDPSQRRAIWRLAAARSAIVGGIFCAVVAVVMTADAVRDRRADIVAAVELTGAKARLGEASIEQKAEIQSAIRELDLRQRRALFLRQARFAWGRWLLGAGAVVLVLSVTAVAKLGARPYVPPVNDGPRRIEPGASPAAILRAVGAAAAALGLMLAVAGVAARWTSPTPPPHLAATPASAPTTTAVAASAVKAMSIEELSRQWPAFRGFDGSGIFPGAVPSEWKVAWKAAIPLAGNNSPIAVADRVLLSGAEGSKRAVFCYSAVSGELLWRCDLPPATPPKVSDDCGLAPSTLASDGAFVFAIFPSLDAAGIELTTGRLAWLRSLGSPDNVYGHAASLRAEPGKVLVQLDRGVRKDAHSAVIALDAASGRELWRTARSVGATWSTPALGRVGDKRLLIATSDPWVIAYDTSDGREVWRAKLLGGEIAPSPVMLDGIVYVSNEGSDAVAIDAGGTGDVTQSAVRWANADAPGDIVSPLVAGGVMLAAKTYGTLIAVDAASGQTAWEQDMEAEMNASPALAGGKVWLLDKAGAMHVLAPGPAYQPLAKYAIDEPGIGSPAFAEGRIFIRGATQLWCIGATR